MKLQRDTNLSLLSLSPVFKNYHFFKGAFNLYEENNTKVKITVEI